MNAPTSDIVGFSAKDSQLLLNTRGMDDLNRRFVTHPITPVRDTVANPKISQLDPVQGVSIVSIIILGTFFFVLGSLVVQPKI